MVVGKGEVNREGTCPRKKFFIAERQTFFLICRKGVSTVRKKERREKKGGIVWGN